LVKQPGKDVLLHVRVDDASGHAYERDEVEHRIEVRDGKAPAGPREIHRRPSRRLGCGADPAELRLF
jgi:hypothetical protein